MKVLKFGGSSVGTPERISSIRSIITKEAPCIVVVSAFQGVTDDLGRLYNMALEKDEDYHIHLDAIINRHVNAVNELIEGSSSIPEAISQIRNDLASCLYLIYSNGTGSRTDIDMILSAGEQLSSAIIAEYIGNCTLIDARDLIKADYVAGHCEVDFAATNQKIRKRLGSVKKTCVVPGFIAAGSSGETVTLGRGGSDYTAAIIAAAINAGVVEIWTDVDGFMSADPRKVSKAYTIGALTYPEAMELSHFGAKVIYTPTLRPVYRTGIPVLVKNTFNPEARGTLISNEPGESGKSPIKGISSIDHISLITLQGPAMVGITGTSARLFSALAAGNINVILITQASSEFSITFAVVPEASDKAFKAIRDEFRTEIEGNRELNIIIEKNLSIIAIVGEKMKNTPGISAILFRSLASNGINVVATAQGSSELNISVVIKNESLRRALNVIHDGFFLSAYKELNLFIAGTGLVGSSLVRQLKKQSDVLLNRHKVKVNLLGLSNSRKMIVDKKGIALEECRELLKDKGEKADMAGYIEEMRRINRRNSVFIDCTADETVALTYRDILSQYVSVITANKIACSSEFSYYDDLKNLASERGIKFMYETTVGAGLPVIKTINDLVLSGDTIYKIEAVLSGTLNFIFNEISPDITLSQAIRKAREKGYSEPDPRVDLSGTDVARKILILAREAGYNLEKEDVEIIRFLPDSCFEGDLNDFYRKVEALDADFENRRKELVKKNLKWRFFATFDKGKARVELLVVGQDHPSYNLSGSNNIVLITTERYNELPMVIKGYGAGADVTAAGVFADLMRVINV